MLVDGCRVWSPTFPCSCERVIGLARGPWRTFECRYEHESLDFAFVRSFPGQPPDYWMEVR